MASTQECTLDTPESKMWELTTDAVAKSWDIPVEGFSRMQVNLDPAAGGAALDILGKGTYKPGEDAFTILGAPLATKGLYSLSSNKNVLLTFSLTGNAGGGTVEIHITLLK